jgi:hypothetical protein
MFYSIQHCIFPWEVFTKWIIIEKYRFILKFVHITYISSNNISYSVMHLEKKIIKVVGSYMSFFITSLALKN